MGVPEAELAAYSSGTAPAGGRLRVLLLINNLWLGGAERHVVDLLRHLDPEQLDLHLLVMEDGPLRADVEQLGLSLTVLNITVPALGRWYRPRNLGQILRIVVALHREFRRLRPDVIHAFLLASNFCGVVAARLAGQGFFIASRRSLGDIRRRQSLARLLDNLINTLAQRVTSNSLSVEQDILANERIDRSKLRLIYNGIDPRPYKQPSDTAAKRRELGIPADVAVVGVVANLSPIKGQADLLDALALLRGQQPKLHVVLVGDDFGTRGALEEQAARLGIAERVHFLGVRRDIVELVQMFDVQVQCSHTEAFSNAVLEAMAAARPLVVTRVGGNPEAVVDGVSGLVVPPQRPRALAAALAILLGDRDLARRMGAAAQDRVAQVFSVEAMVATVQHLYKEQRNR